jgi:hypothetical protein
VNSVGIFPTRENKRQTTTDSIVAEDGIVALDNDFNTVRALEREKNKNRRRQTCQKQQSNSLPFLGMMIR